MAKKNLSEGVARRPQLRKDSRELEGQAKRRNGKGYGSDPAVKNNPMGSGSRKLGFVSRTGNTGGDYPRA
jgi:hypothetical protein